MSELRETLRHIRGIADGFGGDEASRSDPHNALATIVLVVDAALAAQPESAGVCGECGHDDADHVHYCAFDVERGVCGCNTEYARLTAEKP